MLRSRFRSTAVMTGTIVSLCVGFASTGEARFVDAAGKGAASAQVRSEPVERAFAAAMVHGLRLIERLP